VKTSRSLSVDRFEPVGRGADDRHAVLRVHDDRHARAEQVRRRCRRTLGRCRGSPAGPARAGGRGRRPRHVRARPTRRLNRGARSGDRRNTRNSPTNMRCSSRVAPESSGASRRCCERRSVPGADRRRPCGGTPVARTARRRWLTGFLCRRSCAAGRPSVIMHGERRLPARRARSWLLCVRTWWGPRFGFMPTGQGRVGAVVEVDARAFGQYTFTFADSRWATIEGEEDLGHVNAAEPRVPGRRLRSRLDIRLRLGAVVFSDFVRTTRLAERCPRLPVPGRAQTPQLMRRAGGSGRPSRRLRSRPGRCGPLPGRRSGRPRTTAFRAVARAPAPRTSARRRAGRRSRQSSAIAGPITPGKSPSNRAWRQSSASWVSSARPMRRTALRPERQDPCRALDRSSLVDEHFADQCIRPVLSRCGGPLARTVHHR